MINFSEVKIIQEANEKNKRNNLQDNPDKRRKIQEFDELYNPQEKAFLEFVDDYKNTLRKAARIRNGNQSLTEDDELKIKEISRLRKLLSYNELDFIFKFLLQMCKHAQKLEQNSISIGTHLIENFYEKTYQQFDHTQKSMSSELVALNFEMRSKKFIGEVNLANSISSNDNECPQDAIFENLFKTVLEKIQSKDQESISMDEYTSNFFKIIVRSLQTSRQFLDLSFVKKIVDHLISLYFHFLVHH